MVTLFAAAVALGTPIAKAPAASATTARIDEVALPLLNLASWSGCEKTQGPVSLDSPPGAATSINPADQRLPCRPALFAHLPASFEKRRNVFGADTGLPRSVMSRRATSRRA